ncbi:hypothetical protein PR048_003801 [Dryococelus australis]|uniref:Uncharacterized protein n=1 Tax=Dryococelus australis TaxID=614101 RepID=A0ABQ9IP13_9NEOP|nr:hypothetical protein PR048_003801 [Dryococelus australis]
MVATAEHCVATAEHCVPTAEHCVPTTKQVVPPTELLQQYLQCSQPIIHKTHSQSVVQPIREFALNIEGLRADEGEARRVRSSTGMNRETPRENLATSGIVWQDLQVRESGRDPTGKRTRFASVGNPKPLDSDWRTAFWRVVASDAIFRWRVTAEFAISDCFASVFPSTLWFRRVMKSCSLYREQPLHAVRREHCPPAQSLALSGDGALETRGSVVLIAAAFLGLKRGKHHRVGEGLNQQWHVRSSVVENSLFRTTTSGDGRGRKGRGLCPVRSGALSRPLTHDLATSPPPPSPQHNPPPPPRITAPATPRIIVPLTLINTDDASLTPRSPGPEMRRRRVHYSHLPLSTLPRRLAYSPPAKANRVQSPAGSLPGFRTWESCRTMPPVGGFSRGYTFAREEVQFADVSRISLTHSLEYRRHVLRLTTNGGNRTFPEVADGTPSSLGVLLVQCRGDKDLVRRVSSRNIVGALGLSGGEVPEKTRRPAASSGTIPHAEVNPRATPLGLNLVRLGGRQVFRRISNKLEWKSRKRQAVLQRRVGGGGSQAKGVRIVARRVVQERMSDLSKGGTVAERLDCSPPTKENRVQSPGRVTPGFSQVVIVPDDVAGRRVFLGDIQFLPPLHSGAVPSSPHYTLIGSQDLVVKSRLNLSTQLEQANDQGIILIKHSNTASEAKPAQRRGHRLRVCTEAKQRIMPGFTFAHATCHVELVVGSRVCGLFAVSSHFCNRERWGNCAHLSEIVIKEVADLNRNMAAMIIENEDNRITFSRLGMFCEMVQPLKKKVLIYPPTPLKSATDPRGNTPHPRSRSEGAIRATLTLAPSASSPLRARRASSSRKLQPSQTLPLTGVDAIGSGRSALICMTSDAQVRAAPTRRQIARIGNRDVTASFTLEESARGQGGRGLQARTRKKKLQQPTELRLVLWLNVRAGIARSTPPRVAQQRVEARRRTISASRAVVLTSQIPGDRARGQERTSDGGSGRHLACRRRRRLYPRTERREEHIPWILLRRPTELLRDAASARSENIPGSRRPPVVDRPGEITTTEEFSSRRSRRDFSTRAVALNERHNSSRTSAQPDGN